MIGVIMAGGRATRLGGGREKALLELGGRTLLAMAADALQGGGVEEVVAAITKSTPMTRVLASALDLDVQETGGGDYHADILELLDRYGSFISLNVDVPFVRRGHVSKLLKVSEDRSVAAVIPVSIALMRPDEDSVGYDDDGTNVIWVGLNRVTSNPRTSYLRFDEPLLSVNINTDEDLDFARRQLGLLRTRNPSV